MGYSSGWWFYITCFNHLEKYEFVNGKDDIPYMKWIEMEHKKCLKQPTSHGDIVGIYPTPLKFEPLWDVQLEESIYQWNQLISSVHYCFSE
jgi:hypothetical protein